MYNNLVWAKIGENKGFMMFNFYSRKNRRTFVTVVVIIVVLAMVVPSVLAFLV
jgi:hypothetical protein